MHPIITTLWNTREIATARQAASLIQSGGRDGVTTIETLSYNGTEYDLRLCGEGSEAYFEWINEGGDPIGDIQEEIRSNEVTRFVLEGLEGVPQNSYSDGRDHLWVSPSWMGRNRADTLRVRTEVLQEGDQRRYRAYYEIMTTNRVTEGLGSRAVAVPGDYESFEDAKNAGLATVQEHVLPLWRVSLHEKVGDKACQTVYCQSGDMWEAGSQVITYYPAGEIVDVKPCDLRDDLSERKRLEHERLSRPSDDRDDDSIQRP